MSLLPLKAVEWEWCAVDPFAVADALVFAADNGAAIAHVPVGGFEDDTMMKDAARYAHQKGVLVVVPSGNNKEPCSDCVQEPWRGVAESVLIVAGSTPEDEPTTTSGHGPEVDLAAPSYGLFTTEPTWSELGNYSSNGGATSGASAVVAAVGALVKSGEPSLNNTQIEQRLKETAADIGPSGWDELSGYGRVNASKAVGAASAVQFDATFSSAGGNDWWIQVKIDANKPLARVDVRIDDGAWKPLELKSWGAWAESYHAPEGSTVQFRATSTGGATDLSGCYEWTSATPSTCPNEPTPPPDSGDVTFTHGGGNEWWVEAKVSPHPTAVEAMDTGGSWKALTFRDWGEWAGSFHVELGHDVRFRALVDGTWSESCWYTHPDGIGTCGDGTDPPPTDDGGVTFDHAGGSEWWIEAVVDPMPESVEARDTGGSWKTLTYRDWGEWATSFHVERGHDVQFRATFSNGTTVESCWFTHPDGAEQCNSPPPPSGGSFDATFTDPTGNEWWIQIDVDANQALAGVDTRINGGSWKPLELKSWGDWAETYHAPSGSSVEFRARATDGSADVSGAYNWPPA